MTGGDSIPCPHFDIAIVGRSAKHRSAVASASYQAAEKLFSEYENQTKNFTQHKERVAYTEIMLPPNAPKAYQDRATLWNAVEMNEKQASAQYARRFVIALPKELSFEDNLSLARQFCQEQFVAKGMCVDLALHVDEKSNPHFHVLTTMRPMNEHGQWLPKCRKEYILDEQGNRIRLPSGAWKSRRVNTTDWNNPSNCEMWRHEWEVLQNSYLEKAGQTERIDMRSYERQQNELLPTVHLGPGASALEAKGLPTMLGDLNREIRQRNKLFTSVRNGIKKLYDWLGEWLSNRIETTAKQIPTIHELLCD